MNERSFGLFGCFISIVLLALAGFGGYTLFNRYQANTGECKDAVAWHRESVQRSNNAVLRSSELDPARMSKSDARTEAIHFGNLADAQRTSNPPPAGLEWNGTMVLYYEMMSETWDALSTNSRLPYADSDLIRQAREVSNSEIAFVDSCK